MASQLTIPTNVRNAMADALVDLIDAGAGAGTLAIRTGSTLGSGTLLGTLTFSDPAFGAAASGTATASSITSDTNADASGVAGNFTVADSDSNVVIQGSCGESGDSPDMVFDNKTIVAGGTIACSSFTITMPATA